MSTPIPMPRRFRFRLATLLLSVALVALILAVVIQAVRLRNATVELQRLRAVALSEIARADAMAERSRRILDVYLTTVAEAQNQRQDRARARSALQQTPPRATIRSVDQPD